MKISAIIFDMDGLIINSEPLWRKAEIAIFQEVSILLTDADCESTAGLRIDEVVEHWFTRQPWTNISKKEIELKIVDRVIQLIEQEGTALPGIPQIFEDIQNKGLPMAIASSSNYSIINAVTKRLNIAHYFDLIYSAEDEEYGKPHPGIFITAAQKLGVSPTQCLVFEDSFNGVLAGLSARMQVVAIPEGGNKALPKFDVAHVRLDSLKEFDVTTLD